MDIAKIILSDPVNKWLFSTKKSGLYLVGGYVRDLLDSRVSKDRDFVLRENAKTLALKTAKKFNGTFIALKTAKTYRVVLRRKQIFDFSLLDDTIHNNLKERDFTINAIAWSPETGIIDPFEGIKDLNKHIVKPVRITNLFNDPLRTLRAYRIASELCFIIDENMRKYMKNYSKGLDNVASERITEELFRLLNSKNSFQYLNECFIDHVLEKIIYIRNVKNKNKIKINLKLLKMLDQFVNVNAEENFRGENLSFYLHGEISQGLNMLGLLRLVLITSDSSIFKSRLRISNTIKSAVEDINNGLSLSTGILTKKIFFKIFCASDKRVLETSILISFLRKKRLKNILKRAEEYYQVRDKKLLNGNDIKRILKIKEGKKIGQILSEMKEKQFKGDIRNRREARVWISRYFT